MALRKKQHPGRAGRGWDLPEVPLSDALRDFLNWSAAIGISAFSTVLTGWAQGGPVAIHGTNEPWSIGHAVSNGCIRLPNETLRRVFTLAVAGTPVIIVP